MQTVPPNDFGHYELLDALVQMEPAEALDVELAGQFAAIGIVKDEKFAPDDRMRRILDQAVAVGNAASRTLGMGAHPDRRLSATTTTVPGGTCCSSAGSTSPTRPR